LEGCLWPWMFCTCGSHLQSNGSPRSSGGPLPIGTTRSCSRALKELEAALSREERWHELTFRLRPRERAPLYVTARVSSDASSLRWILQPPHAAPPTPRRTDQRGDGMDGAIM